MNRIVRFDRFRSTGLDTNAGIETGTETDPGTRRRGRAALWTAGCLCVAALLNSPALALPFIAADQIYAEDFEAETGFPTTPEVDTPLIGGLQIYLGPIGTQPPPPTISGGRALLETAPFPDSLQTPFSGNGFRYSGMGTSPALGVRIAAGAHALSSIDTEWFGFEAEFNQLPSSVSFVSGGIAFEDSGGGPVLSLVSQQTTFVFPGGGATTTQERVPLSAALSNALLAGTFYELDVFIDSAEMTVVASLEMDGIGSVETAALSLSGLSLGGVPLVGNVSIRQSIPAIPRSHSAEVDSIQLYSDVPEPGFAVSLLLGAGALCCGRGASARSRRLESADVHLG